MNRKETAEIRRQITAERAALDFIKGCLINEKREIVSEFSLPLGTFPEDELERYLGVFRKVLTGAVGKKLVNVDFSTKQVSDGEEQKLLYDLKKKPDGDDVKRFFEKAAPAIPGDEKCVMLIMRQTYDVPSKFKKAGGDSETSFDFIVCAVCPVKDKDPGLCYESDSRVFRTKSREQTLCPPVMGFTYPRFDDRCSNIYGALYYSSKASGGNSFTDAVFKTELPMPADEQKETFGEVLYSSAGDECTYGLVQSVIDHIAGITEEYENDKYADEAPSLSKTDMRLLLEENGVSSEHIEAFCEGYDENFGKGATLVPENVMDIKRIEIRTSDVVIKTTADRQDLISTEIIDGNKYILVRADGPVECNGINIKIK